MTAVSVLKAARIPETPPFRLAGPPERPAAAPAPSVPGIWISHADLDLLKRSSFDEGHKAGQEIGRKSAWTDAQQQARREAQERLEQALTEQQVVAQRERAHALQRLARELDGQHQALRRHLAAEVTEWAFIALTRVLGRQSREDVRAAVRQVLSEARLGGPMRVLLHPADLAMLGGPEALSSEDWPVGISFFASDKVALGGCLIETGVQTLDARLEVQLAILRNALDDTRRQHLGREA